MTTKGLSWIIYFKRAITLHWTKYISQIISLRPGHEKTIPNIFLAVKGYYIIKDRCVDVTHSEQ